MISSYLVPGQYLYILLHRRRAVGLIGPMDFPQIGKIRFKILCALAGTFRGYKVRPLLIP